MSDPTPNVPYMAYKSKRHSRNLSNTVSHLVPNLSTPSTSRPSSTNGTPLSPKRLLMDINSPDSPADNQSPGLAPNSTLPSPTTSSSALIQVNGVTLHNTSTPEASPGPQERSPVVPPVARLSPKKTTMYRRVPRRIEPPAYPIVSTASAPNHTRNLSTHSLPPIVATKSTDDGPPAITPTFSTASVGPATPSHVLSRVKHDNEAMEFPNDAHAGASGIEISSSLSVVQSERSQKQSEPVHKYYNKLAQPIAQKAAPYPPGFQPKGVCRHLTDDFLSLRRIRQDGEGEGATRRVERTKLERRLEKLIALHFPLEDNGKPNIRPPLGNENRRLSSFLDFGRVNISDASDLWRGVVTGNFDSHKNHVRSSEQRITPWEDDANVTKCRLCSATFHLLTNRKHHCRLCGQIICSLPVKNPQRKVPCSILFVVDARTRVIEEVGEGVDYGVRKRRVTMDSSNQLAKQEDNDKFLKGVRICHSCHPVLLRLQYQQQIQIVPPFVRLYESFISLENSIEEALPKFQELLMTLNHNDHPTNEASAARKRLLDSFAHYDKLAKKIRSLPCPSGKGSSQDRVQMAILTRANVFLQKNMLPLQSLPHSKKVKADDKDSASILHDMDADLAHSLQPLLEQETLLESFIEEAQVQRKFEDVKTLKTSLSEIRREIERMLNGSENGVR